jgi:hypothetical protein
MDEYQNIFDSLHPDKQKSNTKGSVKLVATPTPKEKASLNNSKTTVAFVARMVTNLLTVVLVLRMNTKC